MADNLSNVIVGADVKFPTHDVSLTDVDGKQAGLVLCNRNGFKDPTQLKMSSMPRTPMQMTQGSAGYDDMELPFVAEVQTTMSGGRGNETLSSDRTKFFDSFRLDTTKEYPICAPAVIAQTGSEKTYDAFTKDANANQSPLVYQRYISFRLRVMEPTTVTGVKIIVNTLSIGFLGGFLLYKLSKTDLATGNPSTATGYSSTAFISERDPDIELTLSCNLTYNEAGYLYLLVSWLEAGLNPNSYLYYYENTLSGSKFTTGKSSEWTSGTTWGEYAGAGTKTIINIIYSSDESTYKFFEYKRALYAIKTSAAKLDSSLYINGWRGVADTSTSPSKLEDSTQSGWANNAAAGCIVLIINGAGELEDQPWRRVVSSESGVLNVATPWFVTPGTTTEYVVLGSNLWTSVATLDTVPEVDVECMGKAVTSVAVVNDYVVFAFGSEQYMSCYKVDNNTNVFREQWAITAQKADLLMPIVNEQGDLLLWRADYDDCTVDYATPPAFTVTTMTFNFDINAELRADLTLQRDRLYYSLWEELTNSGNDTLLQLTRMKDNLTVEGTRLIGTGTPDSPQAGTLLAEAATRYTNSTADKLAASRAEEDLRLEAFRIIGDGNITTPTTYTYYDGATEKTADSLLKTALASGTDAEKLELQNRIYQLIGNGTLASGGQATAVVELQTGTASSLIRKAMEDSDVADTLYAIADAEYTELYNRAVDIVGIAAGDLDGTVAEPSFISGTIQSELQRVTADIAAEQARLVRNGGTGSDLMRQILDLTYQITNTATESENSATTEIPGYLAAHTDNTNSVAHKYLPANIKCGSTSSRITNIVPYSTPVIPYIMKEDSFGSISDNIYQEIPLAELKSVRAEDNGKTAMHYGVYLYFNLEGGRIERYFDQRIDDIGFNRDEGMPRERQGEVIKLIPYPGRFYAACDAGFSGYSTVMCNNGMGWHEIYRSGTAGLRIIDVHIQAIPGNEYADRLWISEGSDLLAVPIAITPLQQYQYNYFGYGDTSDYGYVETSWVDFELKDVNKYFHSITIFSDYSSDIKSHQEYDIKVWFKVDDEKSWTYAGNTQAYPNKEIELRYPMSPTAAHNVSGKKIKFKIAMKPNQRYQTPRLKAIVINGVLRMPVKQSWNATFLLEPMSDLRKKTVTNKTLVTPTYPTAAPYDAKLYKRLQDWANSKTHATPLLMRTNDEVSDNHYVFIDPMSIQNVTVQQVMGSGSGEKEYKHIATMTLYEV